MELLEMPDDDRSYLTSQQALAIDSQGREVLIGLTREESEWYLNDQETWLEQRRTGTRSREDRPRFLALSEKHELARIRGIGLINAKPMGNA